MNLLFLVCSSFLLLVEVSGDLRPLLNVHGCGIRMVVRGRIRAGSIVGSAELPWLVAIYKKDRHFCTGSIITPIHILSAGHCALSRIEDYVVRYGNVNADLASQASVSAHFRPSDYTRVMPSGAPFKDILILRLAEPLEFDANTRAICLPSSSESLRGVSMTVAGWGSIGDDLPSTKLLREIGHIVLHGSTQRCHAAMHLGNHYEFCVYDGQGTVCKGDSGGPLMFRKNGVFYEVGLVSYTTLSKLNPNARCPSLDTPQMFTRLEPLHDFILDTVKVSGGEQYVE